MDLIHIDFLLFRQPDNKKISRMTESLITSLFSKSKNRQK
ncbi:hypothetical protein CHCC14821_4400 [Bacillus paralicheniformis]|nr:hypothetical protein CHCC14821_4400 [Bacillus paralicheniformis]